MIEEGGGASRTTDSAAGSSAATDVSLREYLTSLIQAAELRSDARFDQMKEMVDAAFQSSQKAIEKADTATEKRFEGVNEFRAQLADQAGKFVTRETMDALIDKLAQQIDRNRQDLDSLEKRIDLRQGEIQGTSFTMARIVTAVTLGVAVLGVLIVLMNYLTTR